jgi:hypothetical protein
MNKILWKTIIDVDAYLQWEFDCSTHELMVKE